MKRGVLTRCFVSALGAVFVCSALAFSPGVVRAEAMSDEDFLDYCVKGGAEEVRQALKDGANPNAKTDYGVTALQSAASSYSGTGAAEKIKVLLDAGADVSPQDRYGRTALMNAAWESGAAAVKVLLSAGAELNVRDQDGLTALSGAAKWGQVEAARVLLEAGADAKIKDNEGHDALWHARHPSEDAHVTKKKQAAILRLLQGGANKARKSSVR